MVASSKETRLRFGLLGCPSVPGKAFRAGLPPVPAPWLVPKVAQLPFFFFNKQF